MTKYRKKPILIEAEQWKPGRELDGICPPNDTTRREYDLLAVHPSCGCYYKDHAWVGPHEGEGQVALCPGDWLITGVRGEHYPCKDGIFQATYDPLYKGAHQHEDHEATDSIVQKH